MDSRDAAKSHYSVDFEPDGKGWYEARCERALQIIRGEEP